ncbi:MAG: protein kinase domain-containing protein, partial [Hyalangium sp.]|uniref:protein kinase domain-containing protein n=1 Tax=Hyalangium sp. TaxID=2028555 RepID=UPI00389AF95F
MLLPQEGKLIAGQFLLKRLIGMGGTGAVWEAHDVQLDRPVAIKLLSSLATESTSALQRFSNEARSLARFRSPHVVQIFSTGIEEGTPYLIMEMLEGESLSTRLGRTQRVPLKTCLLIAQGVAAALESAHGVGLIHRDITPGNIFFDTRGGSESVKVLDFGVAKFPQPRNEEPRHLTPTNLVLGTPSYLSPEQLLGSSAVGPSADLWSLAVVLFEALTGHLPFEADSAMAMFAKILQEKPLLPSQILQELGTGLDAFFLRALAKAPAERFPSAHELAAAFTEAIGPLTGVPLPLPIAPPPPSASDPSVFHDMEFTLPGFPRPTGTGLSGRETPWEGLAPLLPGTFQLHAMTVVQFLRSLFDGFHPVARNVVQLGHPLFEQSGSQPFFAIFVAGADSREARLQTRTFIQYSEPLEEHLSLLESGARKVVIAIVDSEELGGGVRGRIFELRKKFGAIVLPLHVRELASALKEKQPHQIFLERLSDFHTPPDVFAIGSRKVDPTAVFGMRRLVNELTRLLQEATPFISLTGLPGTGKTALIELARYGLEDARFVSVRCIEVSERRVSEVAALVGRALEAPATAGPPPGIRERLEAAISSAKERAQGQRIVLVIEDADFCISALTDERASEEERRDARLFWTSLADQSRAGACAVVVTSLAGSQLSDTVLSGWANPLANQVHVLRVELLSLEDVRRMCTELGRQINVTFDEAALRRIYELSAGNVRVVRSLCSQAIQLRRRASAVSPLQELHVRKRDIARAAVQVAGTSDTFRGNLLPWLDPTDKQVLEVVASQRPRTVKTLCNSLKGQVSAEQCDLSLERLRRMGLVEHREGHERITIPLLEDWVQHHITPPASVENQRRDRRLRYLAAGSTLTLLLFGGYFLATQPQEARWQSAQCVGQINYQGRALPDQPVTLLLFRSCKRPGDTTLVSLSARMGTFAQIGEQQVPTLVLQGEGRPESIPPTWTQLALPVTFRKVIGRGSFELDVRVGEEPATAVIIR